MIRRIFFSGSDAKLLSVKQPKSHTHQGERAYYRVDCTQKSEELAEFPFRVAGNAGILGDVGDFSFLHNVEELDEALQVLVLMLKSGISISQQIISSLLQRFSKTMDLAAARRVHLLMIWNGLDSLDSSGNLLIRLFKPCWSLLEANIIFSMIAQPNVCCWHGIISAHVTHDRNDRALVLYHQMVQEGISPNKHIFLSTSKACGNLGASRQGQLIHDCIVRIAFESDNFIRSTLIDMYAKCGRLVEAQQVLDGSPNKNAVLWTTMIAGFASDGQGHTALNLFETMQNKGIKPNEVTFLCILKACSSIGSIEQGKLIHDQMNQVILGSDVLVGNALIDLYAKCGSLEDARQLFETLPHRTVVSWGTMISGYADHGHGCLALELLGEMQLKGIKANKSIFVCTLKACANMGDIRLGKIIHKQIIECGFEAGVLIGSMLIDMYAKCKGLKEACIVFDDSSDQNVVAWGAMIGAYAQHGHAHHALKLLEKMQQEGIKPDRVIFLCALKACACIGDIVNGRNIHEQIIGCELESDVVISNTLIDMYFKCRVLEDACRVFRDLPKRSTVSQSAMIAGHAELGLSLQALEVFEKMQQEGTEPDKFTFSSALKACGNIGALGQGKWIHGQVIRGGLESNLAVGNSLIDMYSRCGYMEEAQRVLDQLQDPGIASWGALIRGYAQHGNLLHAGLCLKDMRAQGLKPNDVIYSSLLSASSHASELQEGCELFKSMKEEHCIMPDREHITCMADLLGTVGSLQEAEQLLQTTPHLPNVTGCLSLLAACRVHGNLELGRQCFEQIVQLDFKSSAGHVLMSNVYADADMWRNVYNIQDQRTCVNAWRKPGMAWIEVNDSISEFFVGDTSHPFSDKIYANLKILEKSMKRQGHMPQLDLVLGPMSDKDKENMLWKHSEKLAISFGLLSTPKGTTIRVTKNLRMCTDCHNACKIISKIEKRKIIIRDAHRVHEFEGDVCSCGDHY